MANNEAFLVEEQQVAASTSATKTSSATSWASMTQIHGCGFRDWTLNGTNLTRDRGGRTDSILRQYIGVFDLSSVTFTVDYSSDTTALFGHGGKVNPYMELIERPQGTGSGKPQLYCRLLIQSAPKVDVEGAWMFNVSCVGDGDIIESTQ